jgi:glycopeptide antibiotics resistance protein
MQLITSRGLFELSDIINNTLGGLFGILIAFAIYKLFNKKKQKH